jgi:hypothetical protein
MIFHTSASDGQTDKEGKETQTKESMRDLIPHDCHATLIVAPWQMNLSEIDKPQEIQCAKDAKAHGRSCMS